MLKLIFEIEKNKFIWYSTEEYKLDNDFYIFIDKFGLKQKLHKSFYRGEQEVEQ